MASKKITASVLAILLASSITTMVAYAGGIEMPGNYGNTGVTSGSVTGGSGGEHYPKWMKYDKKATLEDDVPMVPQYRGSLIYDGGNYYADPTKDRPPYISAKCHNKKSGAEGVWVLGNTTSGVTKFTTYLGDTFDTIGGSNNYVNDIWVAYITAKNVNGHLMTFIDDNGHYGIYRRSPGSGAMQYNTLSSQNVELGNITWGGESAVVDIYYGTKVSEDEYNEQLVYTTATTAFANSVKDIVDEYVNFMVNSGNYSESDINTAKAYQKDEKYDEAYNVLIKSKKIYAFCSYPEATDEKLEAKVDLTVADTTVSSGYDSSNTSKNITVHTPSVKTSTDFDFKHETQTSMSFTASLERLNGKSYDKAFTFSSSELNNQEKIDKDLTLNIGNNVICSSVKHPGKISTGDNSARAKDKEAKACITVKYEPYVAEIDSETQLTVGGQSKLSGVDSSDTLTLDEVNYGMNALTANWSYSLRSSKRCSEGDFKNGACSKNDASITSDFKVPFNRVGAVENNSDNQTLSSPSYSSSPKASSKSYDLLPGESISEKQGISHKSGVRAGGEAANGAKDESSSVTLNAKAKDAICGLNNKPFGLNNPQDYGRLTVLRTGSANVSYSYGNYNDGTWKDDGVIWLNSNDNIQISYEACIGSQIGKDKESGTAWNAKLADAHNTTLAVETTGNAFDNTLYKTANNTNAVDVTSSGGRDIISSEVIGDNILGHISNSYQFVGSNAVRTKNSSVGHLGQTINNDFGRFAGCGEGHTDCLARATMKIPYNYILEPNVSIGGSGIVTLGNSSTFTITINNNDTRTNEKVQSTPYHTNVKPNTSARYLKFAANTETTTPELLQSINGMFIPGDHTGDIAIAAGLSDIKNPESGTISGLLPSGAIKSSEQSIKVSSDIAEDGYNKICVALAVYPADSHNSTNPAINDDDQSAALTDEFGSAFTRISVACKTVGKYPSASVEGNGIVTGSLIKGSRTEYSGRSFGSWTEYSLVADRVTNIASGASSAYDNPQTSRNASVSYDGAGLKIDDFDSIQTIGNMKSGIGARNDAKVYAAQARIYADSVITTFFNDDLGAGPIVDAGGATYVNANYDSDVAINSDLAELINEAAKNGQVIIYSKHNIKISNAVTELNATLIADGKVDTCEEADQGGDNEQLLHNCWNSLFINGVVYSEKPIALDRIYGGGSVDGMNLDANTLMQRAEILNYDPKIVKWSYDYKRQTQPLTTTYIEELSTRY